MKIELGLTLNFQVQVIVLIVIIESIQWDY